MGTDDRAERALLQGLIKVAAAYVHDVRGNPAGIGRNLEGARALLVEAAEDGPAVNVARLDIDDLVEAIDLRLADLAAHPDGPTPRPTDPAKERPMSQPGDPDDRRRRGRAPAARGSGRPDPARRPRGQRVRGGACARRRPRPDVDVHDAGRRACPTDRPLMVVCHMGGRSAAVAGFLIRSGRTDVVNVAGGMEAWERAGLPVRRGTVEPGEGDLPGRLTLAARSAVQDPRDDRPGLRLVGERPADQQQDDEVHGADAGGVEVAELLADLALDLESGHGRADQAELEERALRRGVGADARCRPRPSAVVPPTRIAFGPEMTAGAPSRGSGRSLAGRCFHSGMSPVVVGTAQ